MAQSERGSENESVAPIEVFLLGKDAREDEEEAGRKARFPVRTARQVDHAWCTVPQGRRRDRRAGYRPG